MVELRAILKGISATCVFVTHDQAEAYAMADRIAVIIDGRVHKLGQVDFSYDPEDFMRPWRMVAPDGRLDLTFTPFVERVAATNLLLIASQVHQMFGRYSGYVVADGGERIAVDGLVGFAEEHHARW